VTALARIISIVFHPLFIPTYSFTLCMFLFPEGLKPVPPSYHHNFIILIFLVTFVLPLLLIGILKTLRLIDSVNIPDRRQRLLPFIVISCLYVSITIMFYVQSKIHPEENLMKLMMIIDALVVAPTLITFIFKISVHSIAVWGVIGMMIPLNNIAGDQRLFFPTIVIIVLAGFIMSSRLLLQAHSLREVLWGSVVGVAIGLSGILILF